MMVCQLHATEGDMTSRDKCVENTMCLTARRLAKWNLPTRRSTMSELVRPVEDVNTMTKETTNRRMGTHEYNGSPSLFKSYVKVMFRMSVRTVCSEIGGLNTWPLAVFTTWHSRYGTPRGWRTTRNSNLFWLKSNDSSPRFSAVAPWPWMYSSTPAKEMKELYML